MKKPKHLLFALMTGAIFASCEKEDVHSEQESVIPDSSTEEKISKEDLQKISSLHFNTSEVEMINLLLPDGSTKPSFLIEGDILMDPEQLDAMSPAQVTDKQYRTHNLVSSPRNVNVIGFTANNSQGLTSKQRSALQRAINNFNALNIGLNFTLTFGTNYTPYDIVVYQNSNGQAGGVAGFPSEGDPYKFVQIFSGMESYSTATNEHVVTHEIGHSIGLRHTDWFSRQSCGQNTNEGSEPYGAVHVPGTPTDYDSSSLMLACFSAYALSNLST